MTSSSMLKLHGLEISGFKTFVDPVDLTFAGGITAIVGPNGCGKSNLSDAITWVLGEQSAKSLRSETMEDVIFTGSDSRKPVGMADVELTLETDPGFEHAIEGRMKLSRRVFRTGQSQYRLNGKLVRLKEIRDLLMDTGLGLRAYSVIEQGKIGLILSGKPQERRRLIEEAAGVTRYKARKRIAEVKLEEATANLLRLDDVVGELERSLRSLKRQAGAARRYQTKNKEYRELLDKVLQGRWALLAERLAELETRLAEVVARDAEMAADLHRQEADLAAGREELDVLARALGARHQEQAELAAVVEGRQELIKGSRQRLAEIGERLERGRAEAERRRLQAGEVEGSLGRLDEKTKELLAEREEAARLVEEDDRAIAAAERDVQGAEARLEGLRKEVLASLARLDAQRVELQRRLTESERRSFRQRYLDEERQRLDKGLEEARATLEAIAAKVAEAEGRLAEATAGREGRGRDLEALLRREAEVTEERRRLENGLASLRERRKILVQLAEAHAQRRRALVAKLDQIGLAEPRFLADLVSSADGWEAAVDHFLGDLADAVVLAPDDDALARAEALSKLDTAGIFLAPTTGGPGLPEVDDPAVLFALADGLSLPAELARALPPAYLVEQAADARRLAAAHPGVAFISRERVWAEAGTLRVQGAAAAPGVLARGSELAEIEERIPADEARLREAGKTLETLVQERARAAADIQRLDEAIAAERRELAVAQARRQDVVGRRDKLALNHKTVADEQGEIAGELELAADDQRRRREELLAAEAGHGELGKAHDRALAEVGAAKERREAMRTAGASRRGRLELLDERLESHHQEALRMRRTGDENRRQLDAWSQEEESLDGRRRELELTIERADEELQIALERRAAAQDQVLAEQAKLDERREAIRALEKTVADGRGTRDEVRNGIETLRVDRAGLRQDAEHLAATFREEFHAYLPGTAPPEPEQTALALVEADDADAEEEIEEEEAVAEERLVANDDVAEGENGEPQAEDAVAEGEEATEPAPEPYRILTEVPPMTRGRLAELEADLAGAKAALERLGPVNVLAADEYDEQEVRYTFLTAQRADVVESVERLRETIRTINETSSERFRETFTVVNKTFGETFARLFRGGEAEMTLLDETDPLETGIEIIARPPGKKTQNIMLLSGGEKALTAIALLFALFQTKPSPFCILDEVDAPLDDVNVLRFVETLKEMATGTQFIVITHNKLTMEAAATLYGVTMEERGVSKLVAVQMDRVQPAPRARSA